MPEESIVLAGYRRVNVLQTGQNSEIWEVVDEKTNQRYALKLLLSERSGERSQRQMLVHEARVGLKLSHPRIIRFHKFVRDRHSPFIVMEHFPGANLKLRLMRGQYEEMIKPRLRSILDQMMGALDYVHEKGWVHRDIKPDNLLLGGSGEVRLIDFALAQRAATGLFAWLPHRKVSVAGTRSYMSPEQIRGKALDGRADLYSLGVMVYEIVAGRLPFVANSGQELLRKHLTMAPPPIPKERKVTAPFEDLIRRLLSKKKEDRPINLSDFRAQLNQIKLFQDEEATEPNAQRSR